jgi:hypothetical protein
MTLALLFLALYVVVETAVICGPAMRWRCPPLSRVS